MSELNYTAIVAATVVYFAIGYFWYGPIFGSMWLKLNGFTKKAMADKKKKGMSGLIATNFVAVLLTSYVLGNVLAFAATGTLAESLQVVAWLWLGFSAALMLPGYLYTGKSVQLFVLDVGYHLVGLLAAGAVIFQMTS